MAAAANEGAAWLDTVESTYVGTTNVAEGKLETALACPLVQKKYPAFVRSNIYRWVITVKFTKLKVVYTVTLQKNNSTSTWIIITGPPGREGGAVIQARILAKAPYEFDVTDFVYNASSQAKVAFKLQGNIDRWPRWGPRGMLVIQWCAYNFGCTNVVLDDCFSRNVMVPDEMIKPLKLSYTQEKKDGPKQPSIRSTQFRDIMQLLHLKHGGDVVPNVAFGVDVTDPEALSHTVYAKDAALAEILDSEYEQAEAAGTIENAIRFGYYGQFGFHHVDQQDADGEWMADTMAHPLEIKNTRMRTISTARWVMP